MYLNKTGRKIIRSVILTLYLLLTAVLAIATLIEHSQGTAFVTKHIYHSVPFMILWAVLSVLMIFSLSEKKNFQVVPKILLHFSFVVILVGALTSYLTSSKGMIHLRMGVPSCQYIEEESRIMCDLPFSLTLDTFYINYYPGTDAPADYVSAVEIAPHLIPSCKGGVATSQFIQSPSLTEKDRKRLLISMNNVLDHDGYRFYQSSYDEDKRGTWLSVNYDPWGTGITYIGYMLLFISMATFLLHPQGGFRQLLRKVSKQTDTVRLVSTIILLSAFADTTLAQGTRPLSIIPQEEAAEKREMQVIYHDRIVPLNTLARDFVKKLYGKESFSDLTPEQILLSWQRYPDEWAYVPAIRIKSSELRHQLGLKGEYARMVDLFSSSDESQATGYRLRQIMEENNFSTRLSANPSTKNKPSPLQKSIIETDEKVALVMMLQNGTLIRPIPTDGNVKPLSKAKIEAELLYNSIPFTKILFMFNLTMGILLLCTLPLTPPQGRIKKLLYRELHSFPLEKVRMGSVPLFRCGRVGMNLLFLFSFLFALTGYLLRWYIGGRIPLSNGYETMLFLALCIMVFALFISRRFHPAIAFGFLLSGFTLLVSYLGEMNPQITPLMPVLVSPWLSLHVSVIMMSYALFAFILLNGVWALCFPHETRRLMMYSQLMLYPAVFLLTTGIFIGSVWANVSWGRYWGWDPKEVWALITLLVYALPLHGVSLSWFRRPKFFHIYLIVAFLTVLITYFGVNYFLGGMHSYGGE